MNKSIKSILWELYARINVGRKKQLYFLAPLIILSSMFEILNIGAIVPVTGILFGTKKSEMIDIKYFFQKIGLSSISNNLGVYLILSFIIITILSVIFRMLLLNFQNKVSYGIGAEIGIEIYKVALNRDYSYHRNNSSSYILSGIKYKAEAVVGSAIMPVITIISSSVISIGIITALLFTNFVPVLFTFLSVAIIYVIIINYSKSRLKVISANLALEDTKSVQLIQEGIGSIKDVILYKSQKYFLSKFSKTFYSLRLDQAKVQTISSSPRILVEGIAIVILAILLMLYSISNRTNINDIIPFVVMMAFGAQRLLPNIQQIYSSLSSIHSGSSSIREVLELLGTNDANTKNSLTHPKIELSKLIQLKNISFYYENKIIFNELSLKFIIGDIVGIRGKSGGGKSTLLDVIMFLQYPNEGSVFIDNIKLDESNKESWYNLIAHVPQQTFLLDGSIKENVIFNSDLEGSIDNEKLEKCLIAAQINEFSPNLNDGYRSFIGENGKNLSGGQRQRIGIARALYRNAEILILDEATSGLNETLELEVLSNIFKMFQYKIVFIVSHRPNTFKFCNKFVDFTDGDNIILSPGI